METDMVVLGLVSSGKLSLPSVIPVIRLSDVPPQVAVRPVCTLRLDRQMRCYGCAYLYEVVILDSQ